MKRFLVLVLLCALALVGCGAKEVAVDYSQYPFADISWTRDGGQDTETIRFGGDGSFSYYCGCGNPVNDADLCEGYTYDHESKTITLRAVEVTDEMVTVIKVISCDEHELCLDFDGDVRVFHRS